MYSYVKNETQRREEPTKKTKHLSPLLPRSCADYGDKAVLSCHPAECFPLKNKKNTSLSCVSTGHKAASALRAASFKTVATCLIPDFSVSSCGSRCLNTIAAGLGAAVTASVSGIEMRQLCVFHHPVQKKRKKRIWPHQRSAKIIKYLRSDVKH